MTRILVVEDDPAVRDVVEHALSREGRHWRACARRGPSTW
jgi:CheY-like chemotaxis protein